MVQSPPRSVAAHGFSYICRSSAYGIPLYVTETGAADKGDSIRAIAIRSYFKQVGMGGLCQQECNACVQR